MGNPDRTYFGPNLRSRFYDTQEARIGYWRCFDRWRGVPCPVCGDVSHTPGCSEAEYEIAGVP